MAERFQPAGFCWSVFLCLVLAVLKLTVKAHWSWGRASLPIWAVLGHNILYKRSDLSGFTSLMTGLWCEITEVGEDGVVSRFVPVEELFAGRHFDAEIVVLCVRWYLSFKLSYRDLVSMMSERGIGLAHTTILRWVQHYTPEFEKRWQRYARPVGGSWRMDETYVKVRGEWVYLYRAVDKAGKTVDFFLSQQRDVNAAKAFQRKAMKRAAGPNQSDSGCVRGVTSRGG